MSELIARATVETIVGHRNRALGLFEEAHDAIAGASAALRNACKAWDAASPGVTRYNFDIPNARRSFMGGLEVPDRAEYLADARRLIDRDVWAHVMTLTDLERLMDKKAKDEFHRQLLESPPEATVENIAATVENLLLQSGDLFRRGIAECFSKLDRRFRSHDGWKIGSRVVITYAFNEFGSWNYHRNERDTLQDVERVFFVLDGRQQPPTYAGIVGAVEESRRGGGLQRRQSEAETEYFIARGFKNGNLHLWFKRDDLLEKVNKLLAEYYGAVIPEERAPHDDGGLHHAKTTPARNFGFFPTPEDAAAKVIEEARLFRQKDAPPLTILEPSAGTGNLARLAAEATCQHYREPGKWRSGVVDCVEIQPNLVAGLRMSGLYRRVTHADFLTLQPDESALYDRVVMNPPFDRERDIDHVMHAMKFLKPDGLLVAIMSAGTEFRETRKSEAFRAYMEKLNAKWQDLPRGTFASVGTNCNTVILTVRKNGRGFY